MRGSVACMVVTVVALVGLAMSSLYIVQIIHEHGHDLLLWRPVGVWVASAALLWASEEWAGVIYARR